MKAWTIGLALGVATMTGGCRTGTPAVAPEARKADGSAADIVAAAQTEIAAHYAHASLEVQEYILHTAQTFGRSGMWMAENAFRDKSSADREVRITRLARLLAEAEYGRHLCNALAEAGALKDPRLVPGLMKVAGHHRTDSDYDCRPKWMAVAALSRQEADAAVPLLIGLVDHGNQNTRMWARAALSRKTGQDFQGDKDAWAQWWQSRGHPAVAAEFLKPWSPPPKPAP
jgi:hypothetical protein